jgi:lipopolysaccharide transport system permease protein
VTANQLAVTRTDGTRAAPLAGEWARNRELLIELVRRDLKARYRGSNLGVAWSLLNPLLYMIVYTVVFSKFVRFPTGGAPYPVYLLSGLLAWNFFSQALSASCASILANSALVKKVAFPRVLLPLAAVLAAFVNYLISLALLIPLVVFFRVEIGLPLILLPAIALVMFGLGLGFGLILSAINVYFRDIEYLLNLALQIGFFMTPIVYQLDLVLKQAGSSRTTEVFRWILYVNPMTWVATSSQDAIAYHRWPQHLWGLGYSTILAFVALALGLLVFNRLRHRFAEEL